MNERWRNLQQVEDREVNGERLQSTSHASTIQLLAKGNYRFDVIFLFSFFVLPSYSKSQTPKHSTAASIGSEMKRKNCN